jgi:putative flavoprotein involved in K+ transport
MSLQGLVKELVAMAEKTPPPSAMPASNSAAAAEPALDVIIVGAGAAGVGCALMLTKTFGLDASRVLLIERGETVGDTFRRWPAEMRFISPSFNQQGWTSSFDLNSIAHGTSPAYSLHTEHPSGDEYADYLNVLASAAELRVRTMTEVVSVQAQGIGPPLFSVGISATAKPFHESRILHSKPGLAGLGRPARATDKLTARYVVWAAGEFQYPASESSSAVAGAELCMHSSSVRSWAKLPGDDFVLIGGCVISDQPAQLRAPF